MKKHNLFKDWEKLPKASEIALTDIVNNIGFNADGLVPAIAQQFDTKEVLMMAWMNREALEETLQTGRVCYYSRSRQTLWRKGESSGHVQTLKSLALDCDGDTILLQINQKGAACHTMRRDCFFFEVQGDKVVINSDPK